MSSELDGLWRHRGMAPNQLVGIGFTAQGWDDPGYYKRRPGSLDPRTSFIVEGIGEDEIIGNFGLVLGDTAGAGDEINYSGHTLGTPAHALCVAASEGHSRQTFPTLEGPMQINSDLMSDPFPNIAPI